MTEQAQPYIGRPAVDPQGNEIGSVGRVYLNDETGQPDWITVNTGFLGTEEHFAPLLGARIDRDCVVLPFDKDVVKDAPDVADASHLDADDQQSLYAYYRQYIGDTNGAALVSRDEVRVVGEPISVPEPRAETRLASGTAGGGSRNRSGAGEDGKAPGVSRPSIVQVEAAKLRLVTDRRLGKESPAWLKRVAKGLPPESVKAAG